MKIKATVHDVLNGKFKDTITAINAVIAEAEGDVRHGTTYSASAVERRVKQIRLSFQKDLSKLADSVSVEPDVIQADLFDWRAHL